MKTRILTNWTFTRILFLAIGILIIGQALAAHEWWGMLFGAYFLAMGVFALGCASGNCVTGNCAVDLKDKTASSSGEEPTQ